MLRRGSVEKRRLDGAARIVEAVPRSLSSASATVAPVLLRAQDSNLSCLSATEPLAATPGHRTNHSSRPQNPEASVGPLVPTACLSGDEQSITVAGAPGPSSRVWLDANRAPVSTHVVQAERRRRIRHPGIDRDVCPWGRSCGWTQRRQRIPELERQPHQRRRWLFQGPEPCLYGWRRERQDECHSGRSSLQVRASEPSFPRPLRD